MSSHKGAATLPDAIKRWLGYVDFKTLPSGINFAGAMHPTADWYFLRDETWVDNAGDQHTRHEIFDEMLRMIEGATNLILLDVFLFNNLLLREGPLPRHVSAELTAALISRKRTCPDIRIIVLTDPCNTVYGALPLIYHEQLHKAGIDVVLFDIDVLRDSNPVYSFLWRLIVRPFGNSPGGFLRNPFGGGGHISVRSYLHIANIKANHRKTMIADSKAGWRALVSTGNPHDASYTHRNVAFAFGGPAVADLYHSEAAALTASGFLPPVDELDIPAQQSDSTLQVLTEYQIKVALVEVISACETGDRLDMVLFYLAERQVLAAIRRAQARGVIVRIILDPNKDAFGWNKSGIPNRPVASRLHRRGISVRWADTRGEQCHSKLLIARRCNGRTTLIAGSANFTRRNLDNFNLETDVRIDGPATHPEISRASDAFDQQWLNQDNRQYTVPYEVYEESSAIRHALYWLMEKTGISTF